MKPNAEIPILKRVIDPPEETRLEDLKLRLVLVPLFGLAIPNLTGLIDNRHTSLAMLVVHYTFFIGLSFLIYQGNRFLLFRMREKLSWRISPVQKILALVLAVVFYTAPLTIGYIYAWMQWVSDAGINWEVIRIVTLFNVIAVIFVVHIYETVFLIRRTDRDRRRQAELELARAEAELEALKNQVDPHFIFNSLNTLAWLIEDRPVQAVQFTENLADIYRYMLRNKGSDVVVLQEELNVVHQYVELLRIRFGPSLHLEITLTDADRGKWLVPPMSVQALVENAVKHNELDVKQPMHICISRHDDRLVVINSLRPKHSSQPGTGTGLRNLDNRVFLLSGRKIHIQETTDAFTVEMPLIQTP